MKLITDVSELTNEQAIDALLRIREDYSGDGEVLAVGREAIDLAIKALKEKDLREKMKKMYYKELRKEMEND